MEPYDEEYVEPTALSYDEDISYEEQVAALPPEEPRNETSGLAGRISANKVYLPPDSMLKGKRKRGDEDGNEVMEEDDDSYTSVDGLRPNALYLHGSPITHLPTTNIFAYARHFDLNPVGLEWIDDSSCVLIFPTNAACRAALETLRRIPAEEPDFDDCISAKQVPVVLWPAEDRINKTLGKVEGIEGTLLIRIARVADKKARGAKNRSAFYQKHGPEAGKDPNAHSIGRAPESGEAPNRHRRVEDNEEKRRQLDEELDDFLREGSDHTPSPPPSPPSKMRSDHMTEDGREIIRLPRRSLLERTSLSLSPFDSEFNGPIRSDRRRNGRGRGRRVGNEDPPLNPSVRRRKLENGESRIGRYERPKKTRQELDDELDAFLNGKI